LMVDSRLRTALIAYFTFTGAALWLGFPHVVGARGFALFALIAFVKLIVGPALILWIVRRYGVPEDLSPSFNVAWRIACAATAVAAGYAVGGMEAFRDVPLADAVFAGVFSGAAILILHRNLLAHVIGLLAIGSAISLAGVVFAPTLSGAVELADTFDIVIATLVALAIARTLIAYDPNLDVRSLRNLRG
jgi:hypothetical protein